MRRFKSVIDFDKQVLKKLANTNQSGVTLQKSLHHLVIQPIQLNNLHNSIKDVLNQGIAKYHQNLDGILLGYKNIHLLTDKGTIHNDLPGIHFDLEADFYIFQPEVGTELKGIVNRKSNDHVGVLVYNSFNVSIPRPQSDEEWLGSTVDVGYEILFHITNYEFSSYLPYIKGEIISIIKKVDVEETVDATNFESKNPKKLIFSETFVENVDTLKEKKKKKKKDKHQSNDSELLDTSIIQDDSFSRKKSKKRKRDEQEDIPLNDLSIQELISQEESYVKKKDKNRSKNLEESIFQDSSVTKKKSKKIKIEEAEGDITVDNLILQELFSLDEKKKSKRKKIA